MAESARPETLTAARTCVFEELSVAETADDVHRLLSINSRFIGLKRNLSEARGNRALSTSFWVHFFKGLL